MMKVYQGVAALLRHASAHSANAVIEVIKAMQPILATLPQLMPHQAQCHKSAKVIRKVPAQHNMQMLISGHRKACLHLGGHSLLYTALPHSMSGVAAIHFTRSRQ